MSGVLGITGASGYIGQALVREAAAAGWKVVAIGRRPAQGASEWRVAELDALPPEGLVRGLDAIVHLAANTGSSTLPAESEERFAVELATQAKGVGIPMVFVSSQAAAADAPSAYGRIKFSIEQAILPLGATAVRPGLVVGGREAGLYGLLTSLVGATPLLPWLLPSPLVQPVHVEDLAQVLLAAGGGRGLPGRVIGAAGEPIPFGQLLLGIARYRLRARRGLVPVPAVLLRNALKFASRILGPQFSPERLDSLLRLPPLDAREDMAKLGITLRPLADALGRKGDGVRRLLLEGRVAVRAAVGVAPPPMLCRRYVRLLQAQGRHHALPMPLSLENSPVMLAALGLPRPRASGSVLAELGWRMHVATRLAEADPRLADAFLMMPGRSGRLAAMGGMIRAVVRELQVRMVAPLAAYRARGLR